MLDYSSKLRNLLWINTNEGKYSFYYEWLWFGIDFPNNPIDLLTAMASSWHSVEWIIIYNNNKRSTNCCAKWHLWQFFLFVLAYIEDFYGCDVFMTSFREKEMCKIAPLPIGQNSFFILFICVHISSFWHSFATLFSASPIAFSLFIM